MARITARQAQTRSRTRRENTRAKARKAKEEAKQNYLRQITGLKMRTTTDNNKATGANSSPDDTNSGSQGNNNHDKAKRPSKIRLHKGDATIEPQRDDHENRKITEYFSVFSKGRENVPKSRDFNNVGYYLDTDVKFAPTSANGAGSKHSLEPYIDTENDVEIVAILPSISEREHPIIDIEED